MKFCIHTNTKRLIRKQKWQSAFKLIKTKVNNEIINFLTT